MRILFFKLLFFSGVVSVAQVHYMPFELERSDAATYSQHIENVSTTFSTELEALEYYFLAYKIQRAQNPAEYFPSADGKRIMAADFLKKNYPEDSGMALVNFLETNGSIESCGALIDRKSGYNILLTYRFLAAFILKNKHLMSEYLIEMERQEMLSEVLKAFGHNALLSIGKTETLATQGIQDLLAIEFALNEQNSEKEVLNLFAENCAAYTGTTLPGALEETNKLIWLSPVIARERMFENQSFLFQSGIGFIYARGPFPDNSFLQNTLVETGHSFFGLDASPSSNADKGFISAYRYFAKAYTNFAELRSDAKILKKSKEINRYIKTQIK